MNGTPPGGTDARVMIVANHVSWLDIYAINTVRAARFIAKSEVRRWPVIGWLCEQAGTFFVERARKRHTAQINEQVAAALMQGDTVAVFPEGTTTAGDVVLPFHASLLQPALKCDALLYPVAIRYTRADGSLCSEADYQGDKSFLDTLSLMVTQPVIYAKLQFLPPPTCTGKRRCELAHEAAQLIASALDVPAPRSRRLESNAANSVVSDGELAPAHSQAAYASAARKWQVVPAMAIRLLRAIRQNAPCRTADPRLGRAGGDGSMRPRKFPPPRRFSRVARGPRSVTAGRTRD